MDSWQRQVGIAEEDEFPVFLDEERKVYSAFGMFQGSTWAIWQPKVIWYYAKKIVWHKESLNEANGDPNQLGGDFLVQAGGGKMLMWHPQADPLDRPSVEHIQEILSKQKKQ